MSTTSYKPQPRELLPEWMIGMTDRIMDFYTKRYLHCDPVILKNPPPPQDGHKYLLYAHIPFCHTLCSYCTFHRFLFKEHVARAYFVNLRKEMDYVKALGYDFHSMYVGGGTTTIIEEELIKTLEHARKLSRRSRKFPAKPTSDHDAAVPQPEGASSTVCRSACKASTTTCSSFERWVKFGSGEQIFERLAACPGTLPDLQHRHDVRSRPDARRAARRNEKIWKLNPRQVTTYPLMVTSQTRKSVKNVIAASGNQLADQYRVILDTLGSRYNHLTSWTFGRTHDEGFDEYVVDYDEYLGVGSGAFSFLNDSLYVNTFSLRRYNERIAAGNTGVERRRQFDKHAILQYRLMLGLFSHRLSRKYFREVHGVNLDRTLMKEMLALRVAGAIKDDPNDPDNIIVTDGGKFLGLVMMKAFYSAMDNVRAELRQPLKEEDYS